MAITRHLKLQLMEPLQINKEVLFNEAIVKMDNFSHNSVEGFTDKLPDSSALMYILNTGENQNCISYYVADNGWQFLKPWIGMVIFVVEHNEFFIFTSNKWDAISNTQNTKISWQEVHQSFSITSSNVYLDLNKNTHITISKPIQHINCCVRNNTHSELQINYDKNILWQDKKYELISIAHATSIWLTFHMLPGDLFLGHINGVYLLNN